MEILLLADSDILIHFGRANKLKLLPQILPKQLCLLDTVKEELKQGKNIYKKIENNIGDKILNKDLDGNSLAYDEWFNLIKDGKGPGESACMALARFEGHHIASNNLRDIKGYCQLHKIRIYTTMDLVKVAYDKGLMKLEDCNCFVYDVKDGGSNGLPCKSFDEYLEKFAGKNPWNSFDK